MAEPTVAPNRPGREKFKQLNGNIDPRLNHETEDMHNQKYISRMTEYKVDKLASSIYVLDCGEIKI